MEAMIIASTAMAALGSIKQGQAQKAQYDAQANAAEYNATVARQNAQVAGAQANAQEEQQRRKFRSVQAEAIAGLAQTGTALDGSNADVLQQSALANELDALTIRYEGQMKSRGLLAQADLDTLSAQASRRAGKDARTAGYLNAGAQLLSGGSKAYGASRPSMRIE